jgi:hypothetical protein
MRQSRKAYLFWSFVSSASTLRLMGFDLFLTTKATKAKESEVGTLLAYIRRGVGVPRVVSGI